MCTVLIRTSSKHRKQTSAYKRTCAYTRYAPNNTRLLYLMPHPPLLIACRVNYWSSDIMHVLTLYLEAGSSDKRLGYAKWYLGVTSLHISSESPCKKFNAAPGRWENWFRKQLCSDYCIHFRPVHANTAIHDPFSSPFEIVIAPLMR